MSSFGGRVAILCLLLAASAGGAMLAGCNKQPDPRKSPDFVDTTNPTDVELKPLGGPGSEAKK